MRMRYALITVLLAVSALSVVGCGKQDDGPENVAVERTHAELLAENKQMQQVHAELLAENKRLRNTAEASRIIEDKRQLATAVVAAANSRLQVENKRLRKNLLSADKELDRLVRMLDKADALFQDQRKRLADYDANIIGPPEPAEPQATRTNWRHALAQKWQATLGWGKQLVTRKAPALPTS